jgi:hypothetical protein
MADPILQSIADTVITRLENITVANGYEFTAADVSMVSRDTNDWQPGPRKILVDQKEEVENEESSYPGNPPRIAWNVQFDIWGFAANLDHPAGEIGIAGDSTTENQMIAAIKKAIVNNDAASWMTFGSNAINARFTSSRPNDSQGHDGVLVTLDVLYRIKETDPYTAG